MLTFLSPAKNLRGFTGQSAVDQPLYISQAGRLAELLKTYGAWQLESLLCVNPSLAMRAFVDFQEFDVKKKGVPALLSYQGLAYQHLSAGDMSGEDLRYAHAHLRILSAFYGVLRAMDGIQPYRLDFHSKLRVEGKNLYHFWGNRLYNALFEAGEPVVNLASAEYARAIKPYVKPQDQLITCEFLTMRGNKRRTIPTVAKIARGSMARWIIKNRINSPEQLKEFHGAGFLYHSGLSAPDRLVFLEDE